MQTVVITGGSDGLGKAIAAHLTPKYRVIILSRDAKKTVSTATEIGCEYKICDVRDYTQVESVFKSIGAVDCLINNAGVWLQGALDETDAERIKDVMDSNALGVINCTKAVAEDMKRRKQGRILNIISQAGLNARVGWPVYIASKWAVTGFTKSMQQELEPFGVSVSGIYPGTLNTEMFAKSGNPKDVSGALSVDDVAKTVEFMLGFDSSVAFLEVGMKKLK